MKRILKSLFKYSILMAYGGFVYMWMELIFRGFTHYSMIICGGLSFILIGLINQFFPWDFPLILQMLVGGFMIVTPLEYLFGITFNKNYTIWSYLDLPFNYRGQICLWFTLLWCLLSAIAIFVDDYMRYYLFNEDKPKYRIF